MKNISLSNITDAAVESFVGLQDQRQRELVQGIVKYLHAYAREHQLSHAEWRGALQFLHKVAAINSESRSEFTLLSDITGVSSLVDLLSSTHAGTGGCGRIPGHLAGNRQPGAGDAALRPRRHGPGRRQDAADRLRPRHHAALAHYGRCFFKANRTVRSWMPESLHDLTIPTTPVPRES